MVRSSQHFQSFLFDCFLAFLSNMAGFQLVMACFANFFRPKLEKTHNLRFVRSNICVIKHRFMYIEINTILFLKDRAAVR